MKHIFYLLSLAVLVVVFSSCNSDGEYVTRNGTICYSYWTFSFGTVYDELSQVDASTFESIEDWLGRDKKHVYFKERLIHGANPATVKAKKYPLCCDNHDYFYKGKGLNVGNVKKFEVIDWNEDDMWAIDGTYAYYDSIRIDSVDISSFKLQCYNTAVDKNHVYRYGHVLPLADPATYVEQWEGLYSRDKSHIWYCGQLMEDVDYVTFVIDEQGPRDKNGHFYHGERVTDEQWQEIVQRGDDLTM